MEYIFLACALFAASSHAADVVRLSEPVAQTATHEVFGASTVHVTFKDYAFFIPTDAGGKTVALAGTFGRNSLSAEQAAHYAKNLGDEPSANAAQFEYVIMATSVSIPKGG